MIEKGKISPIQMAILLHAGIMATAILLVPAITGLFAQQDMWLSPIWASLAGFLMIIIAIRLHKQFPGQTIIQYSVPIIGWFPGKVVGLFFLLFLIHSNGVVVRQYGEFVVGSFLPETPLPVILGSMIFVCAIAVRGGIEVIARSSEIFVPLVTVLFILIVLLLLPDLEPANLLPIFEKGIVPSLMGSIVPAGWFLQFFLISFFLPYLSDKKKALKWGSISVVSVVFLMVITNLVTLFLFGSLTTTFTYPVMEAARYINVADFIQNLESVIMAIWVTGVFIKVSVFYYAIVLGMAQWLNLSDYRQIVFPIGFLLVFIGIWSAPNLQELEHLLRNIYPFYGTVFLMIIPLGLLSVAIIRKKSLGKSS